MKHLNKFNESRRNNYIDKTIVEECFIDIKSSIRYDASCGVWSIEVKLPPNNDEENIDTMIKIYERDVVMLHDIKNALDKLKIEYPNLHNSIYNYDEDGCQLDHFKINISLI